MKFGQDHVWIGHWSKHCEICILEIFGDYMKKQLGCSDLASRSGTILRGWNWFENSVKMLKITFGLSACQKKVFFNYF